MKSRQGEKGAKGGVARGEKEGEAATWVIEISKRAVATASCGPGFSDALSREGFRVTWGCGVTWFNTLILQILRKLKPIGLESKGLQSIIMSNFFFSIQPRTFMVFCE